MALTIQLSAQEDQTELNLRRWEELQRNQDLATGPLAIAVHNSRSVGFRGANQAFD